MAKSMIGLQIDSSEVAFSQVGVGSAHVHMPENFINSDGIVSPESLSKFLKGVKNDYHFSGSDVSFILPDESTFFRTVDSPAVSEQQLKLNLPYEFRDFVGSNSIDYNYDYVVEGYDYDDNQKVTGIKLLAAAANKDTMAEYIKVLKRAGLKVKIALPHEMSIINLLKANGDENKEYCFIGISYEHTHIYIFKGKKLTATKLIDIGCKDLDEEIARNLNIDPYLASSYRDTNHEGVLDSGILDGIYDRISLEVMKTINFYKYENNESDLDTAYFFAMGSKNETLCNTICSYVDFKKGDIKDILPSPFEDERGLMGIGLIL